MAPATLNPAEVMDEVMDEVNDASVCIECGEPLPAERVELGFRYCTRTECQARHHRGLTITTFGVNKSADSLVVADPDEIRRRGEAGEFGRKDSALGLDYRPPVSGPAVPPPRPSPRSRLTRAPVPKPVRPMWSPQQEKVVRLYHGMGLNPPQIVSRARKNAPRLVITEGLVVRILSSPPPASHRPGSG